MTANGHGSVLWCHELCVTGSIFHLVDLQSRDRCIVEYHHSWTFENITDNNKPTATWVPAHTLNIMQSKYWRQRECSAQTPRIWNKPQYACNSKTFSCINQREALWRQRKWERSHNFSCMCKGETPRIRTFSSSHVWETTRLFVTESLWLLTFPENPYHIHQLTILFSLKTLRKLSLIKLNMKFNLKISTFQSDFCFCHAYI